MSDNLLNTTQAASYLNLSRRTLEAWRTSLQDTGPTFVRLGRAVRYTQEDLNNWLERQRQVPQG